MGVEWDLMTVISIIKCAFKKSENFRPRNGDLYENFHLRTVVLIVVVFFP